MYMYRQNDLTSCRRTGSEAAPQRWNTPNRTLRFIVVKFTSTEIWTLKFIPKYSKHFIHFNDRLPYIIEEEKWSAQSLLTVTQLCEKLCTFYYKHQILHSDIFSWPEKIRCGDIHKNWHKWHFSEMAASWLMRIKPMTTAMAEGIISETT